MARFKKAKPVKKPSVIMEVDSSKTSQSEASGTSTNKKLAMTNNNTPSNENNQSDHNLQNKKETHSAVVKTAIKAKLKIKLDKHSKPAMKKNTVKRKVDKNSTKFNNASLKSQKYNVTIESADNNKLNAISKKLSKNVKPVSPVNQYNINDNDDIMCRVCDQKLDNQLKFYSGEPEHGFEEEIAILDSRLLLFDGHEENVSREDTRAYNKITSFSVYCKHGHLCAFDSGLIEKDIEILFSGYVKPIFSDDPSTVNSVPGKNFGPIAEWWITGFDVGEKPTVALSTELADYILMKPADEYASFMDSVIIKILISKTVIEYLIYKPNACYEDLLSKLQSTSLPGCQFTEDTLMRYASFICGQVASFDETAKPYEPLLVVAPCIRRLIDLAGIDFEQGTSSNLREHRKYRDRRSNNRQELQRRQIGDGTATSRLLDELLGSQAADTAPWKASFRRCENCVRCRRTPCSSCPACLRKQPRDCWRRRCFYSEIQEANSEETRASVFPQSAVNSLDAYRSRIETFACFANRLSWPGEPLLRESGRLYYGRVDLNGEALLPGDFVLVYSVHRSIPAQVVRVAYLWQDEAGGAGFHANYLWAGEDTCLGELARPRELFFINHCSNMPLSSAASKVKVDISRTPRRWRENRGVENHGGFFCERSYNPTTGAFADLPIWWTSPRKCLVCDQVEQRIECNKPMPLEPLERRSESITYGAVLYRNEDYRVGHTVYLKPKTLYFKYPMLSYHVKSSKSVVKKTVNEEVYPELYRKFNDTDAKSTFDVPAPFDLGYITEILTILGKLYIKIQKLYRPENTHKGEILRKVSDVNMVFWSDEVCTIAFSYVVGKCHVAHAKNLNQSVGQWSSMGPDRFYFTQKYNDKEFLDVDRKSYSCEDAVKDIPKNYPMVPMLKTLDIYAGCGGMSLGLRQAGIANCCWAIESDVTAATTYKLNIPETTVIIEDCDSVLKKIKGETRGKGKNLPKRGDVELLCASLPRENYYTLESLSAFKISSIATFVSYCEHLRPLFFVLVADKQLIKRSAILKRTLTCFVSIGYQVTFDFMQVGCYGVPQNQTRSVLLGAAPGRVLPKHPKYLHLFPKSLCQSTIIIDNKKYTRENDWIDSAPYRTITVRDGMSDLPNIEVGKNKEIINYNGTPTSHYQKIMRQDVLEPTLFDHICKDFGPLVQARISQIPTAIGSDWRNLPNIETRFRDGRFSKKLIYEYEDIKTGRSSNGARRGVCGCSSGGDCDPNAQQEDTLIPWHLVHSANRHAGWPGLYGRLQWNGYFNGTPWNPEPLGSQGPVLHPMQPRTVSVRECARAQGFPDDFCLGQSVSLHDKYRQIGRACSPLLARAIGRAIAEAQAQSD